MAKKKLAVMDDSIVEEVTPKVEEDVVVEQKSKTAEEAPTEEKKAEEKGKAKTSKKTQPKREIRHGKKYFEAEEKISKNELYPIDDAVNLAKETSYTKFDGSLEIHIQTSVKGLRGLVSLPYASGKKLKILAFGKGAEESGADMVGDDAKLADIEKGRVDFDVLLTTAEWMPRLARLAKVLGPRGLMPNPKNGSITDDLKKAVSEFQAGKTEYKSEKVANIVHLSLGKLSQPTEQLSENLRTLLLNIGKSKVKKVYVSPTMGPGIKVDISSL